MQLRLHTRITAAVVMRGPASVCEAQKMDDGSHTFGVLC